MYMVNENKDELLLAVVRELELFYLSDLIDFHDREAFKKVICKLANQSFELREWNTLIDYIGRCWDFEVCEVNSVEEAKAYLMNM